jgi:hypothetical protein
MDVYGRMLLGELAGKMQLEVGGGGGEARGYGVSAGREVRWSGAGCDV